VETLDYPFELVAPVILETGLSVCLDVGHLWLGGYDVDESLKTWLSRTRIVHLHGVRDGKDHLDLAVLEPGVLRALLARLGADRVLQRVVTLEVFGEEPFEKSMNALSEILV